MLFASDVFTIFYKYVFVNKKIDETNGEPAKGREECDLFAMAELVRFFNKQE